MLIDKCSFSAHFQLASVCCFTQLLLSCAFFPFVEQNFYVSAMERKRSTAKNKTKSNINKIMRTYLLCMKKGVSSVDEKKTRNDNNKLRRFILQLWGVW